MFKTLYELLAHKYVRSGETVILYYNKGDAETIENVKVEGWGKYAAVKVFPGYVRRDLIKKDALENWYYRYESDYG